MKKPVLFLAVCLTAITASAANIEQLEKLLDPALKPAPTQLKPICPKPVHPEPTYPNPIRPKPTCPKPVRPQPVRPEPICPEPIHPNQPQHPSHQARPAQYDPPQYRIPQRPSASRRILDENLLTEKLYVTVITPEDPFPFLLNTSTADLWKLSPAGTEWIYLGDPRGARSGRAGKFQLIAHQPGRVLILDTTSGKSWRVDGSGWIELEDPRTRPARRNGAPKTWDEIWEEFKNQRR